MHGETVVHVYVYVHYLVYVALIFFKLAELTLLLQVVVAISLERAGRVSKNISDF